MKLDPQLKRDLVPLLARLFSLQENIKTILDLANAPIGNLQLEGPAQIVWSRVISYAEENDLVLEILEAALSEMPGSEGLKQIIEEIKNGDQKRIKRLAKLIKDRQCILFLGPGMLQVPVENVQQSFSLAYTDQLKKQLNRSGIYYDSALEDEPRYISQRVQSGPKYVTGELGARANDFFNRHRNAINPIVYEQLASLTFPLVINTNPDKIIWDKIKEARGESSVEFKFYNQSNSGNFFDLDDLDEAPKQLPETLVYNIFGAFDVPLSVLFTEADFVKFSKNILQKSPPLHKNVIRQFDEAKYYLFLGFDFGAWHLKMLLEALKIVREKNRSISIYGNDPMAHDMEYYDQHYKFYFCNRDILHFTTDLLDAFNSNGQTAINT